MNGQRLFELAGVEKHLGAFRLKVDVLHVETGETLCLLGPTGSGKSTLLRLLSCLDSPSAGQVNFRQQRLDHSVIPGALLRQIATVPQRPLPLRGTVRYNVEYGLRVRRGTSIAERSNSILDRLGLTQIADQEARSLSGGQLQLVALARALVIEPDVLLLDEPTAHLDPANVGRVEGVISEVQQRTGMTVVWASHNLFQARRVATRIGLLLNGTIVETAHAQKFFENPSDQRTKEFVEGRMVY